MDIGPSLYINLAVSVLLSAIFSGVEIAYLSANRLRLELDRNSHTLPARLVRHYIAHPNPFIAALLVGNNAALVVYSMAMSALLNPWLARFSTNGSFQLVSQTLVSTVLILLLAEFLPKALFRAHPIGVLRFFSIPIAFFYAIFYPLSLLITRFSAWLLRLITGHRLSNTEPVSAFGRVDLNNLVDQAAHTQEVNDEPATSELRIFQNALEFHEVKVRDCLVPRPDVAAIDVTDTIPQLQELFISSNYSRIPVYEGNIDNIIGYVNAKALFSHPGAIRDVVRPLPFVPETMRAGLLLQQFIKSQTSIAVVVDEFGGTAGIITIEDLVEEIFGEINDEHDTQSVIIRRTGANEYLLSGRAEVDAVNEQLELNIPESEDYDTIAGFILSQQPSIPKPGDVITIDRFQFRILQVDANRIDLLHLTIAED